MTSSTTPNEGFAGFGKFVPGFDFLQNLVTQTAANAAQNSTAPAQPMPGLGSWIAPTLNVEDLDRRIKELKTVQFWLDQNATALKATITALEVQKMTLSTLKDMNFSMAEVANAFKIRLPGAPEAAEPSAPEKGKSFAGWEIPTTIFGSPAAAEPAAKSAAASSSPAQNAPASPAPSATGADPMQWWGALTQQFQTIAADAMKDVTLHAAKNPIGNLPGSSAVAGMAEKAGAAMAASSQALADNASKTLASTTALMGASLKNSAWPMSAAAAPGASKGVKKAPVKATAPAPASKKQAATSRVAAKKAVPSPAAKVPAKAAARKTPR